MRILISKVLKKLCKDASLGVLSYRANVTKSSEELLVEFDKVSKLIREQYELKDIIENPHIKSTRLAYKCFGKDPNRYRNAAEAMLRRLVKGSKLYQINSIVDINNIISISSGYSIGSYDSSQLRGEILFELAKEGANYHGIGKGITNVEYLPTLCDSIGPFGSPTSDSQRAMVGLDKKDIISVVYSFDGKEDLNEWLEKFSLLLKQYANVMEVEKWVI